MSTQPKTRAVQRSNPPGFAFPGMSQAVRCGDFILVSGQVALKDGVVVGVDDAERQAEQCFENIRRALVEAGAELGDIVALRCYLTRGDAYNGYAAVKNRLFADHPPCATGVIVQGLLLPDLLMEVEATAWKPQGDQ